MTDTALRGPADPEMFRMKVGRFKDRHYYDPLPADDTWEADTDSAPYPSVSTIKKITSQDFSQVAARRVAEYAVYQHDAWVKVAEDSPETAIDLLVGADRRGLKKAGERGTAVHGVMENLAAGRSGMLNIDASAIPYLEACKAFIHDNNPTFLYTEVVAINRKYKYGGTLDCIVSINGKMYIVDWKSRKAGSHAAYDEEAWQVAAYANADYYIVAGEDGLPTRVPVPHLDGGLIVSICPGEDSYRIFPIEMDNAWAGFVQMRSMWEAKHKFDPIGKPIELNPRTYKLNVVPPVSAPKPVAEPWDPFGTDDETFAGLPTGDADGTTHPVEITATVVPTSTLHDRYRDQWVEATWMNPATELRGQDGGTIRVPSVEQRLQGWLVSSGDAGLVLADDSGNRTTIVSNTLHVEPVPHVGPAVVPIGGGQAVEDGLVQPEVPAAPPVRTTQAVGPIAAMPARQSATMDALAEGVAEYQEEVRAWLRRRLASDIEQLGGQGAVMRYWPPGMGPLKSSGPITWEELDAIEDALMRLERDMQLSFPETKPGLPTPEETAVLDASVATMDDEPAPEKPKVAHPDDVEALKQRAIKVKEDFPKTFDAIQAAAKEKHIPGFKFEMTEQHVADLDAIITEQVERVEERKAEIESRLAEVSDDERVLIPFALGPSSDMKEPSEDDLLAIQLLTDMALDSKLVITDQGELGAGDELMEEARKFYPDRVQLFRGVNPYLTRFGFSTVTSLEALRRRPLGIVMMLHNKHNDN